VEPGFSVPHPQAGDVHAQPPVEPPTSATMKVDQNDISSFSLLSPISGDSFSQTRLILFRCVLVAALIRTCILFFS
jgi:hypothetical protein